MNRSKPVLALIMTAMVLVAAVPVTAQGDEPTIIAEVDERKVELYTVNLTLDNQYMASDVPPVLFEYDQQYRTLVPVAAIAGYTGADVKWNGETREVTIVKADKTIVLTIDSAVVIVNGEEKILPSRVPAKIVTYQERGRTMVPVAFLGQELGLNVGWDDSTRTVRITTPEPEVNPPPDETAEETDHHGEVPDPEAPSVDHSIRDIRVTMRAGMPEIRVQVDAMLHYSTARLMEPDRLVFDLDHSLLLVNDEKILQPDKTVRVTAPDNQIISAVRSSQFDVNPNVVRLVLDLKQDIGHQVTFDGASGEMVIRLVNYVEDVRFERFNTREMIVIEGNQVANHNIMHLENPRRLVIDVKDSVLNPSRYIVNRNIGGRVADRVRISEFKPDDHYEADDKIVRVVVDLNRELSRDDLYIREENGILMVHLEGEPDSGYRYEETGWTTSRLTFFGKERTAYHLVEEIDGELIQVTMPADNMNIPFQLLDVGDPLVEFIQITETDQPNELKANIHLKPGVELQQGRYNDVRDLVLEFSNRDLKYREKLIVIDPGHGGRDPGAISPNLKMMEKDVVLEVAKEAQRLLEAAGFRTYMTRTDDTYVSLQDRAGVANQLRADLFISIHSNAAPRSDLKGVETLYYPSEKNPDDFRDNRFLAEIFQTEMVRTLGSESHRINARDKLVVLRETKMPAIITEIGFKTNLEEERLLATSEYRRLAAQGVSRSVIRYFEESLTHLSVRP